MGPPVVTAHHYERESNNDGTSLEHAVPKTPRTPSFKDRLEHFTWAWYNWPLATGGLAIVLAGQPHEFPGLRAIGIAAFFFDVVIFICISSVLAYRFITFPGRFRKSLIHPTESLFVSVAFLCIANFISCTALYGIPGTGPWLITAYRVVYWIWWALAFLLTLVLYLALFILPQLKIQDITPAWALPIFPMLLTGVLAYVGSTSQPPEHAIPMLFSGVLAVGLGMLVSMMIFSNYFHRLIQYGLPPPNARPAMFIAVGPPSFAAFALIGMSNNWPGATTYFGSGETTVQILRVEALFSGVFLWLLALWFFFLSVIACLIARKDMSFKLNWWAFVFPNVGIIGSTFEIGNALQSEGIKWIGTAMTILLVAGYFVVLVKMVFAVVRKTILWPGKDEDSYAFQKTPKLEQAAIAEGSKLGKTDVEVGMKEKLPVCTDGSGGGGDKIGGKQD